MMQILSVVGHKKEQHQNGNTRGDCGDGDDNKRTIIYGNDVLFVCSFYWSVLCEFCFFVFVFFLLTSFVSMCFRVSNHLSTTVYINIQHPTPNQPKFFPFFQKKLYFRDIPVEKLVWIWNIIPCSKLPTTFFFSNQFFIFLIFFVIPGLCWFNIVARPNNDAIFLPMDVRVVWGRVSNMISMYFLVIYIGFLIILRVYWPIGPM